MLFYVLAILVFAQTSSSSRVVPMKTSPLNSSEWVARSERPPAAELVCTDYSSLFWSTFVKDGLPHATAIGAREHLDALPFRVAPTRDRQGNRHVLRVPDGWIVGFDDGEFGGGLWSFSLDGTDLRRIRPDASELVKANDPRPAENVVGLPTLGRERLVLMGRDHLTGRSGRIFRLVQDTTGWRLSPLAVVDAAPNVWLIDGNQLLFLTESGLWSIAPAGRASRLYQSDIGGFSPSAMVRAADGGLYIGLRHYVLKLQQANGIWRKTWFTPASCGKVELQQGRCECVR